MHAEQATVFPAGKSVYGIRAEKVRHDGQYQFQYAAYKYEIDPDVETQAGWQYVYAMQVKRWLTLELALMQYAVRGIMCFPIFGQRPDCISEKEILCLADEGFDKMLKQIQEARK